MTRARTAADLALMTRRPADSRCTRRRVAALLLPLLGAAPLIRVDPVLAKPPTTVLASASVGAVNGDGDSTSPSPSASGTKVAFQSLATNLASADPDAVADIYVKDLVTGAVTVASSSDDGIKGNGDSTGPVLSASGSRVAFMSLSTNLDPADTDVSPDIYVKDLTTGDITLASSSSEGIKANALSETPFLSPNGVAVAFQSYATNLSPADTDDVRDIFVKNLMTGEVVVASTSDTGVKANGGSAVATLDADGTTVAFHSFATNLDPGDTDSTHDIYVKDLSSGDLTLASTSTAGVKANATCLFAYLSANGRHVGFGSAADNLHPADTNGVSDVWVKDLSSGELSLASTPDDGGTADGPSAIPVLSASGRRVAFRSLAANLDPADTDAVHDVYVKDLTSGDIVLASTSANGVKGDGASDFPWLSLNGRKVFFHSQATNLDPDDMDAGLDVFARTL